MTLRTHSIVTLDTIYELTESQYAKYLVLRDTCAGMSIEAIMRHPSLGMVKSSPAPKVNEILRDRAATSTYDPRAAEALLKQTAAAAKRTPLDRQVGGMHYKNFPIQPVEFAHKNKLTFLEGCVVKRVARHSRGGKGRQDIEKAIHELQMILQLEYGDDPTP